MFASLIASSGEEILALNLHPLQSHAVELDLLKAAERSLMTVVAQVFLYSFSLLSCTSVSPVVKWGIPHLFGVHYSEITKWFRCQAMDEHKMLPELWRGGGPLSLTSAVLRQQVNDHPIY